VSRFDTANSRLAWGDSAVERSECLLPSGAGRHVLWLFTDRCGTLVSMFVHRDAIAAQVSERL
jgi:hypothetical protein